MRPLLSRVAAPEAACFGGAHQYFTCCFAGIRRTEGQVGLFCVLVSRTLSVDEAQGEGTGATPSLAFVLWDEALEKLSQERVTSSAKFTLRGNL